MTDDPAADTVPALLWLQARTRGAAPAIIDPERQTLSYASLQREVAHLGTLLGALGFGRGSRIAVALPSGPEAAIVMLATMSWNVCALLDPTLESTACRVLLEAIRADALIAASGGDVPAVAVARGLGLPILQLASAPRANGSIVTIETDSAGAHVTPTLPSADDLALIMHTSGTTTRPKIVPITHAQLVARARLNPLVASDRGICAAPTFTSSAVESGLLATLASGASVMFPRDASPERIVDHLGKLQPTYVWASPAVHVAMLEAVTDRKSISTASLRFLRSGSSALPPILQENLEAAFGVPVMQGYGLTETGVIARNPLPPGERRPGSVGKALGMQVRVMAPSGEFLPRGGLGEIVVQGPGVMSGYEDPEANRLAFRDGWFRTGDLGYFGDDDFLFLCGRLHDTINRGGRQVAPAEIDAALLAHPAVLEAAAFAVPHPSLGEDIVAAVVLREPRTASVEELREHAFAHLAGFKVPTALVLVDSLPKNALGKVQRSVLADTLRESLRAGFLPPRDADEELVAGLFAEVLGLERVGALDNFFELGGDSLSGTRVVARVNSARGVDLPIVSLFEMPTVADFACAVRGTARANS